MSKMDSEFVPVDPFSRCTSSNTEPEEASRLGGSRIVSREQASPFEPVPVSGLPNRRELIKGARELQRMRMARSLHLPNEMFGEASWDIMLVLYTEEERRSLSLTAISMIVQVPMTTLLRWITFLEVKLLVVTEPLMLDGRVRLLKMTDHGRQTMDECLTDMLCL